MAKDYKEFRKRIKEESAFAEEVDAKGKSIAEAEDLSDDREVFVKIGKELGYEFTVGDIERYYADEQELDDKELERAAGGFISSDNQCWFESYGCIYSNTGDVYCPEGGYH